MGSGGNPRLRGQSGQAMLLMLGITLFIFIISIALLAMTSSSAKVARGSVENSTDFRDVDSALEKAVNAIGKAADSSPTISCDDLALPSSGPVTTSCSQPDAADLSVLDITAQRDSNTVGSARIRVRPAISDEAGSSGARVDICDWQLAHDDDSPPLGSCEMDAP